MNIEKKVPTISGTASIAQTFQLDEGLHHNFKQGVPVHFEIWAVSQTAVSDTAKKGHSQECFKFTITFAPWLGSHSHRFFLLTYLGLSLGFP